MSESPLISIIMPTYNREKLLPRSIETVINQQYTNWELIVVDDRSADGTKALIESFSQQDPRIKYLKNHRKKGPGGARNCGIIASKGEYIAFLDSDDEWLPHHLSDSMKVLQNEGVNVCFALRYERHSGELVRIDQTKWAKRGLEAAIDTLRPRIKGNLIFFGEGFYEFNLTERFYLYHINTMVYKRDVLQVSGLFDENLAINEDDDFMFRVFHDFDFCFINDYHFIYNEGQDNLYLFTGRYNMDPETAVHERVLVDRLTKNMRMKIKLHKNRKRFIRKSAKVKDKAGCLTTLNGFISKKYFTLGYLNRKVRKGRAFIFYLNSLHYEFTKLTLSFLLSLLAPRIFKETKFESWRLNMG